MEQTNIETKPLDTPTQDAVVNSLDVNSSEVNFAEWQGQEVRKGRLVIRVPSLHLAPKVCVCTCSACVCTCRACIKGCFPCTLTA